MAAAWFEASAPPGWRATSAGFTPQATISTHVPRLLAGTLAGDLLDYKPPRHISAVPRPDVIVAIDCPPEEIQSATVRWQLHNSRFDEVMRDELKARAERLAEHLVAR
jgi:hypothetical protein